ncbi:MAG: hypothetical protein FJ293_00815 [Planctomycetes bacterium]|nr:hypothetical protein [Planctomycetota bacterium]
MLLATLFSLLPFASGPFSGGDTPGASPDGAAPPAKSVKAPKKADPFAEVIRLKRQASGQSVEQKHAALTAAAKACEEVAKGALEPAVVAEAHWRAGELWRTLRHEEEARRCFSAVTGMAAADPRLAAKAWLELGHLDRRAKRWDAAIANYRKVPGVQPEQRRESAQSLTWQGKALLGKGAAADGHALLLAVGVRFPELPLEDIRNVDLVACDWIEVGRVEEARELVAECVARHTERADDGDGESGDEDAAEARAAITRALSKMKAGKQLAEKLTQR